MNVEDYENIVKALEAVSENGTLNFKENSNINEAISLNKPVKIKANGSTFTAPIEINANASIDNANIQVAGTSGNDKDAVAIKVLGDSDFELTNSNVNGVSRNPVLIKTSGKVNLSGNTFNAGNKDIYNAVEFSISNDPDIDNVTIENNTFTGTLGNNAISMYNFKDGAVVNIVGNNFENIDPNNNPIRLSNPKNANVTFNIENNKYSFSSDVPTEYTGFMLLQDYSGAGSEQEFDRFKINFTNLTRGEEKLMQKGEGIDRVYYVYDDQDGILLDGVNDPVVTFA